MEPKGSGASLASVDLVEAGYVAKDKDGRRNRYRVEAQLPLPEPIGRDRTIGEVLALLVDVDARRRLRQPSVATQITRPPCDRQGSGVRSPTQ